MLFQRSKKPFIRCANISKSWMITKTLSIARTFLPANSIFGTGSRKRYLNILGIFARTSMRARLVQGDDSRLAPTRNRTPRTIPLVSQGHTAMAISSTGWKGLDRQSTYIVPHGDPAQFCERGVIDNWSTPCESRYTGQIHCWKGRKPNKRLNGSRLNHAHWKITCGTARRHRYKKALPSRSHHRINVRPC